MNTGQFKPGQSGNPAGRPLGARNKRTLELEDVLHRRAPQIVEKAADMAMAGDQAAIRVVMSRLLPTRRGREVSVTLPAVKTLDDAVKASQAIMAGLADGELTPAEAGEMTRVVESYTRLLQVADHDERLRRLEAECDAREARDAQDKQPA